MKKNLRQLIMRELILQSERGLTITQQIKALKCWEQQISRIISSKGEERFSLNNRIENRADLKIECYYVFKGNIKIKKVDLTYKGQTVQLSE